jgi:hypothetical protein
LLVSIRYYTWIKSVAGHACLFIHVTVVEGQVCVIVVGIFVDDLLFTGNSVEEITKLRERINQRFIFSDQEGNWNIIWELIYRSCPCRKTDPEGHWPS